MFATDPDLAFYVAVGFDVDTKKGLPVSAAVDATIRYTSDKIKLSARRRTEEVDPNHLPSISHVCL